MTMTIELKAVPVTIKEVVRTAHALYLSGHTAEDIADAYKAARVPVIHPGTPRRPPFIAPALKPLIRWPVTKG
ncbi:hypothetical protein ADL21_18110 [Streptomyces albus subsp. albus]|nr:hypothetical protein ADL21_18110 [Streptomyces albus subsp. albus]